MENIIERIKRTPVIFDGPMGTMIYGKGVFINTCYDELILTKPELISEIHNEYKQAGADLLETNTFGANRIKLTEFGLADKISEINTLGVQLAKEVAGDDLYVAGAVGPCSNSFNDFKKRAGHEYEAAFEEQCQLLADAGVDLIQLESFSVFQELQLAIKAASKTGKPISACFSVNEEGVSADNLTAVEITKLLKTNEKVDIIGINCGIGPAAAYRILSDIIHISSKPVIVMPNAGLPQGIGGRVIYMTSPEYFMKYAKRFIQLGAKGVGGCCGIRPDHIEKAVKGIKNLSEVKTFKHVKVVQTDHTAQTPEGYVPFEKKSRFAEKLSKGEMVSSIEVLPPKSIDISKTLEKIKKCYDMGVDAVNIPDGPRASARLSNLILSAMIQNEIGIEVIPHYCCRDRNLMGMQGDIMAGYAAGIKNFLCVTGDPPNIGDYPEMTGVFDLDAIGLTQMISNLNYGFDLGGNAIPKPTGVLIGVAANPNAVDIKRELKRFQQKISAGADYAITQPVFDADSLIRFVEEADKNEKKIPIIAGVWPLASYKNAQFMAKEVPGVIVPNEILERMSRCTSKEDNRKVGIEIARETCEKIKPYVQGFQVSAPFGNVTSAFKVLEKIY